MIQFTILKLHFLENPHLIKPKNKFNIFINEDILKESTDYINKFKITTFNSSEWTDNLFDGRNHFDWFYLY